MIDSFPDLYRVSTDDGETADYTLNGMVSLDAGDEFVFQPDTTGAETIGDSRLPLGKITMVTTRQGDVYLFPSNRLQDARPATKGELMGLAFDYLASAPFVTPAEFMHTKAQIAAMGALLSVPAEMAVEEPESPVEPVQLPEPSTGTDEPKVVVEEVVASPKVEAPAVDLDQSASPEPESPDPSPSNPLASLDLSQPVSPDPEGFSPPADSPAVTTEVVAGDGPTDTVKATEILIVNVEDEPTQ